MVTITNGKIIKSPLIGIANTFSVHVAKTSEPVAAVSIC